MTLFTLQIPLHPDKLSQSSVYFFDNARGDRFMNDFTEKRDYYRIAVDGEVRFRIDGENQVSSGIVKNLVIIQLKNWKKCLTRFFCIFSDFKEDCLPT
ncbi:MAG: hypothetical protein KZQ62_12860, partial [Candidatus Thiodiazotropha sp. (ex Lucinoma aequizonata)]|nr:hypothetical protein [Candidatus Thiodiazotropha sp. (ex Lucinoma aequizonata)]